MHLTKEEKAKAAPKAEAKAKPEAKAKAKAAANKSQRHRPAMVKVRFARGQICIVLLA